MAMTEEENFIRIYKLVNVVAPIAVRQMFDKYFPPMRLTTMLQKEELKLRAFVQKKWLTTKQMALLFPTTGVTSSSSYDATLMICLLRNLTTIRRPVNDFDVLPPSTEIHDGADLARVKYYRNKISHPDRVGLQTSEFTTVWNDLEQALVRLGGANIKAICDDIKQSIFSHNISLEVFQAISKSHEEFQLQAKQLVNKIEEFALVSKGIKECSCSDLHEQEISEWEQQDEFFVKTHAVEVTLMKLQTNPCITVTGKPGMGKSAIIHHIALLLRRSQGYTIVPCTDPQEIKTHFKKDHLQVFVFDDVCGRYSVNHSDVGQWIKYEPNIKSILSQKMTKVISSCRLQVFLEKQFKNINIFKGCSIDLTSDENSWTTHDKIEIALKYLDKDIVDRCSEVLEKCELLPLTCFLCKQNSPVNIQNFLSNPFEIYTNELNSMEIHYDKTKWFALFLCILHNGKIDDSVFEQYHSHCRKEFETILDQCGVNIGTSTMYVKEQLESLVGTYIKKTVTAVKHTERYQVLFTIIHDKMFDFLCHYFGINQQKIFIKHADSSVLGDRTQLESLNEDHDQFTVIITIDNEAEFFFKILTYWKCGHYMSVLNYDQMKFKKYREKLINYIRLLGRSRQKMSGQDLESALNIVCKAGYYDVFCFLLETKSNINHDKLLQSACYGGNVDIVIHLINMGAYVNSITFNTFDRSFPLLEACTRGHLPLVTLLIDKGADVNLTTKSYSPLSAACEGGHLPVITLLMSKGADINHTTESYSPLSAACKGGHLSVVTLLIDKEAEINRITESISPLSGACNGGHLPIVSLLIDKGADVNHTTDNYSPLSAACEVGHLPIVTLLIDKGADINQTTSYCSPLVSACEGGYLAIVTLLIDKGADINKSTCFHSPLSAACRAGHFPIVTLLIDKGADINLTTNFYSPLISACEGGHLPLVNYLIEKGAIVNHTSDHSSPLSAACAGGHLAIVTALYNKGAEINHTAENYLPLAEACQFGHLPIVSFLVDKGANINHKDSFFSPLISACTRGNLSFVSLLIDKGADINQTTNIYSPLLASCEAGCLPIVNLLIDKGADVSHTTNDDSPLSKACAVGHIPMVIFLIDKGADVNRTTNNNSPLISACRGGHLSIVTLLIDKGADVNHTTDNYSPLSAACEVGNMTIIALLIDKGADVRHTTNKYSALISACRGGHLPIVTLLIDKGADVNHTTDNYSPLSAACEVGHLPIVTLLIDKGADINQTTENYSPLISACEGIYLPIVTLLIYNEADINRKTNNSSPLISACRSGYLPIVSLLIHEGADIDHTTNYCSPLISACEGGYLPIVSLLIDKGANVNLKSRLGQTPLYYAKNSLLQNSDVVNLLVLKGAKL